MIKFNLKSTKTSVNMDPLAGENYTQNIRTNLTEFLDHLDLSSIDPKTFIFIALKILIILCFPLGLKVYEVYQINILKTEREQVDKVLTAKNGEVSHLNQELEKLSYLKKKAEEYESKKNFLKNLAYSRLIVPKILDQIQSVIPETVCLLLLLIPLIPVSIDNHFSRNPLIGF